MKFIIIGLGNFGSSLGMELVNKGEEVIGADLKLARVELYSKKFTYTVKIDSTDEDSIKILPLKEADKIIICIGEDVGAAISTTALIKKHAPTDKIYSRAMSSIHHTILVQMGIVNIINPEASFAKELANRLCLKGALKTMLLDSQFEISEVMLPDKFVGKTILELDLRKKYNMNVVTIIRNEDIMVEGQKTKSSSVLGVVPPETALAKGDILVLFGKNKDIEAFMEKYG